MKKLLVIAYYFPPSGGPGVQRVLKHVKYLPEFGWDPIVLTVENGNFPARDESLLNEIPENCKVYRSKIFEPYDLYRIFMGKAKDSAIDVNVIKKEDQDETFKEKLAEFIRSTFFIPDARAYWRFSAKEVINQIFNENDIHAVYSSSPPYTCSIIGRNIKRKTKLPWVAGFRDPWTGFISSPKRWFIPKAIDKAMEHSVFKEADFVECAWQGIIEDALDKYPDLDRKKFIHVPNGFDSNDFPEVTQYKNEKFTICYTGSLYGRRNPSSFFAAIESLISKKLINADDILLRFVGRFGNEVEEMFEQATFKSSIETISYVPHSKSIEYLLLSDCLLLIVDESKESKNIVPGKVYEYIGVRKPLLAIAPKDSDIAELIRETRSGYVAHQSEVSKTAEILLDYFKKWKKGEKMVEQDENEINKYERRNFAKRLAELLNASKKSSDDSQRLSENPKNTRIDPPCVPPLN
jgi:hypothetical protein